MNQLMAKEIKGSVTNILKQRLAKMARDKPEEADKFKTLDTTTIFTEEKDESKLDLGIPE